MGGCPSGWRSKNCHKRVERQKLQSFRHISITYSLYLLLPDARIARRCEAEVLTISFATGHYEVLHDDRWPFLMDCLKPKLF